MKTNFIYVTAAFDTSKLPKELHKYMLLFLDLIQESPVKTEDEFMPYEEVVSALEQDMISYDTSLGIQSGSRFGCGPFSSLAAFNMQIEVGKFEVAINWMT